MTVACTLERRAHNPARNTSDGCCLASLHTFEHCLKTRQTPVSWGAKFGERMLT